MFQFPIFCANEFKLIHCKSQHFDYCLAACEMCSNHDNWLQVAPSEASTGDLFAF